MTAATKLSFSMPNSTICCCRK